MENGYDEVTVLINGAEAYRTEFTSATSGHKFLKRMAAEATASGYETEVYIMHHPHDLGLECECYQYATSHLPAITYNQNN